jgi:TolA-binding protein
MSAEHRLRTLTRTLASAAPVLDDVTRARVGARLAERVRAPTAPPVRARRWPIYAALTAAAAVVGIAAWPSGGDRATVASDGDAGAPIAPIAPIAPAARPEAPDASPALVDGATAFASARGAIRRHIDGAELTLYGPGWIGRRADRLAADGPALVVDHARADAPLVLEYRGATIRTLEATFAVSGASIGDVHVAVMRGAVTLACGGVTIDVRASGTATCPEPAPVAPAGPAVTVQRAGEPATDRPAIAPHAIGPAAITPAAPRAIAPAAPPAIDPPTVIAPAAPRAIDPPTVIVPAAPPAVEPPPAPPPPSAAALYARAEDRMRAGDRAGAQRALQAILDRADDSPEQAPAMLELARILVEAGDDRGALAQLEVLAARADGGALAAPATYLRCTALVAGDHAAARACFTALRARFPRSFHAVDALGRLAALAADDGDCAAARPLIDQYLIARGTGALADALRTRCAAR